MQEFATVEELFNYKNDQFDRQSSSKHRRYFQIAGITVCLESDFDFANISFKEALAAFAVDGPGEDNVILRHHFELPDLKDVDLGKELYRKVPWAVSIKDGIWCYKGIVPDYYGSKVHRLAFFNADHTRGIFFSTLNIKEAISKAGWDSLSLLPTDQIWLGSLLADRNALLLHSAAAIVNGRGLIFVGHSEAGKTTTMELLMKARPETGLNAEILCDDRNVIRRWPDGWRVHGTWSHGDIATVSPSSAPLQAVLFLEQAKQNEVVHVTDRKLILQRLLATLVRPMITAKWWEQELNTLEQLIKEVPCYSMRFDKSGIIVPELGRLIS